MIMVAFVVAFTGGNISWSVMVFICGSISWSMVLQLSAHVLAVVEHGGARCSTATASAYRDVFDRTCDVKTFDCGRICIEWRIRPTRC